MEPKLTNPIRIRLDKDLDDRLKALAIRRGETKADLCRRLLRQSVAEESARDGMDPLLAAVRQAVGDAMKPSIERLAKINSKTSVAAATSMYMEQQVYNDFGKDARALFDAARKKAVAFVKQPNDEWMGDADG